MFENTKLVFSLKNMIITVFVSILSVFLYYNVSNITCSITLIILGIYLFFAYKKYIGYYTNMIGIYSIIWFVTIGLATLRLHKLQTTWKLETWCCLIVSYLFFCIGYGIKKNRTKIENTEKILTKSQMQIFLNAIIWLPIIFFFIEVFVNHGVIPMFSKDMSSYRNFGATKLHFITVSCCFALPTTYIYMHFFKTNLTEKIYLLILNLFSLFIPVLIVSRQLIIVTVVMTAFVLCLLNLKYEKKFLLIALIMVFVGWFMISAFRNQDDAYLKRALYMQDNSILNVRTMQIYMYICFNYDNFDLNVDNVEEYSYGAYSIYPFFGLTGLKKMFKEFHFESLTSITARIIPTYNTYPIVMTPYLDGGIIGVVIYMFVIGLICSKADNYNDRSVFAYLMNIEMKCCLTFAFFTAWFSNQAWWFYVIYLFLLSKVLLGNKKLPSKE